jgi:hypothetical protein
VNGVLSAAYSIGARRGADAIVFILDAVVDLVLDVVVRSRP